LAAHLPPGLAKAAFIHSNTIYQVAYTCLQVHLAMIIIASILEALAPITNLILSIPIITPLADLVYMLTFHECI
jgi:hypothetical protein